VTPSSVGGNFNRYWYGNSNPYGFKDPDGRKTEGTLKPGSKEHPGNCHSIDCFEWEGYIRRNHIYSVSYRGQEFIKAYEQLRLTAYDAHPPNGDWTIGYGHKTNRDAGPITQEKAEALFAEDVLMMTDHVLSDLQRGVTQNQLDAFVSLRFNVGQNNVTPPVRSFNKIGYSRESDFTKHYITAGGELLRGLVLRRVAEWKIYSEGIYDASH